jgi:hypothetical protein
LPTLRAHPQRLSTFRNALIRGEPLRVSPRIQASVMAMFAFSFDNLAKFTVKAAWLHTRLLQHPLGTLQCTTALCNVPSLALRHEMFDKSTNFGPGLSKRPPKLFYKSPGTRFGPGFPPETLIIRIVFVGEFQTNRQTKEPKTVLGQEPKTVLDAVEALVVAKTCDVRSDLVLCMGHSVFFCLRG